MGRALLIAALAAGIAAALLGTGRSRVVAGAVATGAAAPRMLELYTPWCPACAEMKPVVDELAERCAGVGVRIDAVDVSREENERLAERYDVGSVPTFLFLDQSGSETSRLVGAQSAERLRRGLEELGDVSCGGPVSSERPRPPAEKEG